MPSPTEQTALLVYIALMGAGAILFCVWSRDPRGVPAHEYAVAIFIPVWSGLAYLSMLTGQGIVTLADGREVYVARYLDWTVTTPLLLTALFWTATHRARERHFGLLGLLIGFQVVMILSGLIADLSPTIALRNTWFAVGCGALLAVFWIFWVPLRRIAARQGGDLSRVYAIAAGYLTVQWLLYPAVVYSGPSYAGLLGPAALTWLLVIVPFFSKVGFSFVDLYLLRRLDTRPAVEAFDATGRPLRA